jgi:two-component SAPR family response regulator
MKTIVVDDEKLALLRFEHVSKDIPEIEIVGTFQSVKAAKEFLNHSEIDLAVLDIEINGSSGIDFGKLIVEKYPHVSLIYVTGYEEYAFEAFKLHAASYLLKPFSCEDLQYAIDTAKLLRLRHHKKITIKTFGLFDIFVEGKPVFFQHSKTKELLALLVDAKGSTLSSSYVISKLWENRPFDKNSQSLCYKSIEDLQKTMETLGFSQLILKTRKECCLNTQLVDCDYYRYLNGEKNANDFCGEYMSQYSWAEETLAQIYYHEKKRKN